MPRSGSAPSSRSGTMGQPLPCALTVKPTRANPSGWCTVGRKGNRERQSSSNVFWYSLLRKVTRHVHCALLKASRKRMRSCGPSLSGGRIKREARFSECRQQLIVVDHKGVLTMLVGQREAQRQPLLVRSVHVLLRGNETAKLQGRGRHDETEPGRAQRACTCCSTSGATHPSRCARSGCP